MKEEQTIFQTTSSSGANAPQPAKQAKAEANRRLRFRLTPRDIAILKALLDFKMLTTRQIQQLFFPSSGTKISSRCQTRLTILTRLGLVERREQPSLLSEGRKPLLYFLSRQGAEFLTQLSGREVDWHPHDNQVSPVFLAHELGVADFRIIVTLAARKQGFAIEKWLPERELRQQPDYVMLKSKEGRQQRAAVIPDGYFLLHTEEYSYHHFVEVDRSTVTGESSLWWKRDWARRVRIYLTLLHSGKFEQRFGDKGFRVLTIAPSAARVANLVRVTESAGGRKVFWFSTFDNITAGSVLTGKVWQVATEEGSRSLIW